MVPRTVCANISLPHLYSLFSLLKASSKSLPLVSSSLIAASISFSLRWMACGLYNRIPWIAQDRGTGGILSSDNSDPVRALVPGDRLGLTWALQNLFISSSLARRMRVRRHVGYLVIVPEFLAKVSRVCGRVGPVSRRLGMEETRRGKNWDGNR